MSNNPTVRDKMISLEKFPVLDRFGNPYTLEDTDEVKIKGDVENIK